jgi:hypothetical protein
MGLRFSPRLTSQPSIIKGYGSLFVLEHHCFRMHFQGIPSKMHPFDLIIEPIVLHGVEAWGPSL